MNPFRGRESPAPMDANMDANMELNSDELLQEPLSLRENYSEFNDDTLRSLSPDHVSPGIYKNVHFLFIYHMEYYQ